MCVHALELCPLNLYFLYNNPAEVCSGQRPPFFDMKSIRKVFGWRLIYVNQLLFSPLTQQQRLPSCPSLSPTANPSPALITLQITGERLLAERRLPDLIVCLRLLFVLHK